MGCDYHEIFNANIPQFDGAAEIVLSNDMEKTKDVFGINCENNDIVQLPQYPPPPRQHSGSDYRLEIFICIGL